MIPHSEHMSLHAKLKHKNGILITPSFKNHHHTKEAKEKISIASKSRKHCGNPNIMKKVQCIETQEIFNSLTDAAKWCNLKDPSTISSYLHGKGMSAGKHPITHEKLHWKYI